MHISSPFTPLTLHNWQRKVETIRSREQTSWTRKAHHEFIKDSGHRLVHIGVLSTCPEKALVDCTCLFLNKTYSYVR